MPQRELTPKTWAQAISPWLTVTSVGTHLSPQDSVDRLLEDWSRARPDLDLGPVAVIARIGRLRRIIEAELEATYAEHGLNGADFATLVTLRRLNQPHGVSQTQLMRALNLSSGTISMRVERLAERGLVTRATDPADRRNSRVTLSEAGHHLFERVTPAHVATEERLLAALTPDQRAQLVDILRTLLVSFEGSCPDGTFPHLGLALAPAHLTVSMRRGMGLPECPGLLVRHVQPGSRADHAGIKVGDVLVRAGAHQLRSITMLYAAINQARPSNSLTLTLLRGEDTSLERVLDLHPQPEDPSPPGNTAPPGKAAAHML
jgi:DNA-binding MarR family transcriptional regulator